MKLGSINLSKMYVGVSEVIKTYIGSTQNYSNDPYYVGNFLSPELTFDFAADYYRTNASDTTFSSAITHSRASNATMVDSDGLIKWAPHNLALNSASPATQTIAVISGVDYTVECTGVSIALSGAGTGTVTEGNPVEITASTTSLTLTVTGSTGTMWCYRSDLGGMVDNPDRNDSYVPTTTSAVYLPRRGHHVYNGTSWVNEGILIESEARTNVAEDSNEFDTANWSLSDAGDTLTSSATVSPDGETNAWLFAPDSTSGFHSLRKPHFFTAGIKYTISVFLKSSGRRYSHVAFGGSTLNLPSYDYRRGIFDLESGSVYSAPTDGAALIEPFGNGWYRCSVTITPAFTTSANLDVYHAEAADPTLTTISDGNGTDGIYIYGAQLEASSTPSSYIPTSGSTITRAADTLTVPAANLPYDSTAMSIQMQGRMSFIDDNDNATVIMARWQGASGQYIQMRLRTDSTRTGSAYALMNNGIATIGQDTNGAVADLTPGVLTPMNAAGRFGSTFLNAAMDGVSASALGTPTALPDLSYMDLNLAPDYMGTIKTFRMWNEDIGDTGIEEASS